MKKMTARWRLYTNLLLLSAVLITSFQNCTRVEALDKKIDLPLGLEITTE